MRKRVKAACAAICACGLLLVLGTAGASDHDLISGCRALVQTIVGAAMFCVGYAGGLTR